MKSRFSRTLSTVSFLSMVILAPAAPLAASPAGPVLQPHATPQAAGQPQGASLLVLSQKVDPLVLESAARGPAEFIVFLPEQADLSGAKALAGKVEKGRLVYDRLVATAARTQGPLVAAMTALGLEFRPYWVANMIWVRGDMAAVRVLAARADVSHIYANPRVHFEMPSQDSAPSTDGSGGVAAIEPGVSKVHAPDLWTLGFTGQGVVVGGQDTGYDWDHPALINKYRGWNGTAANHNYNWHDSIHSGGGICGANSMLPCDDNSHGTHTMGTMIGDDGGVNQIGVAPGAKWIGCRNMDQGNGTPITYSECYQWFVAPTDLAGLNPDPSKAPDVINNSWGCPVSEGCVDPNILLTVVDNLRAAGIVTVHSAGNSGPGCSSVTDPAAIYASSFTAGATDINDVIASFSSRGPVTVDGSNRLKPNICGPGVNVRSSFPGTGYGSLSGTSMAGPHVVGVVALLMSSDPQLIGNPSAVESLLESSAVPRTSTQTCGGVPGSTIPNNTFGFGRVDALNAYNANVPPVLIHIGDLDARTQNNGIRWGVEVTILVLDGANQPVTGATVSFVVNAHATRSCTTGATGTCFARATLPDSQAVATAVMTSVAKTGTTYDPLANTDPDGDSNGTTISVNQP